MAEVHCSLVYNHAVPNVMLTMKRPVLKQEYVHHRTDVGHYVPAFCIDGSVHKA